MKRGLFFRSLCGAIGVTLVICYVAVVPPWDFPTLWAEVSGWERDGLVVLLGMLVLGVVGITAWESRRR